MLEQQQERQRAFVRAAMEAKGLDATNLARAAGVAPSTLNRFLNQEVNHLLSGRTLSAISRVSGIPVPRDIEEHVAPVPVAPQAGAVAEAPAINQVDAFTMRECVLAWLAAHGVKNPIEATDEIFQMYQARLRARHRQQ